MFHNNGAAVNIGKTVAYREHQLRITAKLRGWLTGCGVGSIERPTVLKIVSPLREEQLGSDDLISYLRDQWYTDLVGTESAPPVWVLARATLPGSSSFESSNYIHDALLSGKCGAITVGPPIANTYHDNDRFQSAITTYLWTPAQLSHAVLSTDYKVCVEEYVDSDRFPKLKESSPHPRSWIKEQLPKGIYAAAS